MPPKVAKPGAQAAEAAPAAPVASVDLRLTLRTHPQTSSFNSSRPASRPTGEVAAAADPAGAAGDGLASHLESTLFPYTSVHIRIVSDWLESCVGTSAIGAESSEWIEVPTAAGSEDGAAAVAIGKTFEFTKTLAAKLPVFGSEAEALAFIPRVYVIVVGCDGPERIVPLEVLVLDCSPMALSGPAVVQSAVASKAARFSLMCTATNNIAVLNPDIAKKNNQFRVLNMDIKSIVNYPVNEGETEFSACNSVYLYGNFDFGCLSRRLLARPNSFLTAEPGSGGGVPVNAKTSIVVPSAQYELFCDALQEKTIVLEVHNEDLCRRAFPARVIDKCTELYKEVETAATAQQGAGGAAGKGAAGAKGAPAKPAAAPAAGKKGAKVEAAPVVDAKPPPRTIIPYSGPQAEFDQLLIKAFEDTVSGTSRIKPHGTIRLRLEKMLETSPDLLKRYEKLRRDANSGESNKAEDAEQVSVSALYSVELRGAKAWKPDRWTIPDDLSLKKFMKEASVEKEVKNATLVLPAIVSPRDTAPLSGDTMSSTARSTFNATKSQAKTSSLPKHERYLSSGTTIRIQAEFRRPILDLASLVAEETLRNTHLFKHDEKRAEELSATAPINPYDRDAGLTRLLNTTPYTRMVFIFKYSNDALLEAINEAVNKVNKKALPNIQGTIRSYALTPEEIEDVNNGKIDLVCGFTIIDDDTRMFVLEGLAGCGKGMEELFVDLPRFDSNNSEVTILSNPEVLFHKRLYTSFGPDPKRIRPREKIKKLVQRPELYDRKQVDTICFSAFESLMGLLLAEDMYTTKEFSLYPDAESLNKFEILYGEAISKEDIDGKRLVALKKQSQKKSKNADTLDNLGSQSTMGTTNPSSSTLPQDTGAMTFNSSKREPVKRSMDTDCWNPYFEEHLAMRDPNHPKHDFIKEQRMIRRQAWREGLERRARKDEEDQEILARLAAKNPELANGRVYTYAGQSRNIKEMMLSDLRDRLKDDRSATYTYSADFQSMTVCLVDEDADRLKIQAAKRALNISSKNFIYPAPKTREELIIHPKKPSEFRCDDLKLPYLGEEQETAENSSPEDLAERMKKRELQRGYDNTLTKSGAFGMLEPIKFERPFELSLIGDRSKLPRGLVVGGLDPDPNFWRSVHVSGSQGAEMQAKALEAEKEEWMSKVVVDDLSFKIGKFLVKDKVEQWQRCEDILRDEPQTVALKMLYEKKTTHGDPLFQPTPLTIMSLGDYVPNAAETALLRTKDATKFITTQDGVFQSGVPKDFTRFISTNANKPKIQTQVHKRKHPPLSEAEKTGSKWTSAA